MILLKDNIKKDILPCCNVFVSGPMNNNITGLFALLE